jgi:hypothetical protein
LIGRACLVLVALAAAAPAAADTGVPMPVVPRGAGEACVEPVDLMRREHMDLLYAHRDETVRRGDRDTRHSLSGCVDCHSQTDASGARVAVDAPGQFCASCHEYASVAIDCFQCHATVPPGARPAAGDGSGAALLDRLARALFGGGAREP